MNFRVQLAIVFTFVVIGSAVTVFGQTEDIDALLRGQPVARNEGGQAPSGGGIRADIASILCIHKIEISAQADGLIQILNVDEGSEVKKDEVLMVIDSRVAQAELEVAKRELEAARIQAEQTANIEFSKAAKELAEEEYEAEKNLYNQQATTYSAVKRKRLEAQKAFFSVDLAKDDVEKEQLAAAIAREKVNASQVKLDLYRVSAPRSGIIVERIRDLGEWIRAGEPVLKLLHMDEMKIQAYVSLENISLSELHGARMQVRVRLNPRQEATYEATVDWVSPEVKSGRAKIVSRIANQKDVNGAWVLIDGMNAEVEIFPNR